MKAVTWQGDRKVSVDTVSDPEIMRNDDCIVRVTSTAICGSDLHLYDGVVPMMERGDVLGHEFMGEVVEVGKEVKNLKVGDRVVVPYIIACGNCEFCKQGLWSLCDNSNPNSDVAAKLNGYSTSGLFGYSHIYGGYSGGQAQFVRVPYADVGPLKIENGLSDEKVLFLSDILPTGWMAAENAQIPRGGTVAIWGCGPVGQMTIQSAWLQGAGRVIAIDNLPERLQLASTYGRAEVINHDEVEDVVQVIKDMTDGKGPDSVIDAVGMEAHGSGPVAKMDQLKQYIGLTKDIPYVLRQAIMACGKGGTVSIIGVYAAFLDHVPLGAAFAKGLTFKMGQVHIHRYMKKLLGYIEQGKIDPSEIISHRLTLDEAPQAYEAFRTKSERCTKVVMSADF